MAPSRRVLDKNEGERLAIVEESLEGLHSEFGDLRRTLALQQEATTLGFAEMQTSIAKGRETNWTVVFMGLAAVIAIYGAAIAPLKADIQRQENAANTLALAVIAKEDKIEQLQQSQVHQDAAINTLTQTLDEIRLHGSPVVDKRITVIEYKLGLLK